MSGSPSIDPRQAGRFDISRFRESQPIYVTHRHIVHLAAAIGIPISAVPEIGCRKVAFSRGVHDAATRVAAAAGVGRYAESESWDVRET